MTSTSLEPPEPPEIYEPGESDEHPRYVEDWRDGTYLLTGRVMGSGARAMGVFFAILLACFACWAGYMLIDAIQSAPQPHGPPKAAAVFLYGLPTLLGMTGAGFLLLWPPMRQRILISIGPQRTTVRYEPASRITPAIDVSTSEVMGFLTKTIIEPRSGNLHKIYMHTSDGDLQVRLFSAASEGLLAGPACKRLTWALARVRRLAQETRKEPPPKREPYRD